MDRPSLIAGFFKRDFGSSQTYMKTVVTAYNYSGTPTRSRENSASN